MHDETALRGVLAATVKRRAYADWRESPVLAGAAGAGAGLAAGSLLGMLVAGRQRRLKGALIGGSIGVPVGAALGGRAGLAARAARDSSYTRQVHDPEGRLSKLLEGGALGASGDYQDTGMLSGGGARRQAEALMRLINSRNKSLVAGADWGRYDKALEEVAARMNAEANPEQPGQ